MKYLSLLLLVFVISCDNQSSNSTTGLNAISEADAFEYSFEPGNVEIAEIVADEIDYKEGLVSTAPKQEQKIIKTARLTFEVKHPDSTHSKILGLARRYDGVVQKDNSGKDYNKIYRNLIVRVPTANFQEFIDGVSEGVGYFDVREISQKDVAEEFVDLKARLIAKRELEGRYLELLTKAKNVEEMLQIERQLAIIREEIESKQGRLQFLQNRVSMSTVHISFYKTTAETSITVSYGQKMGNALRGGWNGVSAFFLGILYLWPLLLLGIILTLVLRSYVKRNRARTVREKIHSS